MQLAERGEAPIRLRGLPRRQSNAAENGLDFSGHGRDNLLAVMELLRATLWVYQVALLQTLQVIKANPAIVLAPLAYGVILSVAARLLAPLGLLGGFLSLLVFDACASSGLFVLERLVKAGRADMEDFLRGFGVYLLEVVRVSFLVWVPLALAGAVLGPLDQGPVILAVLKLLLFVFLNAVPEFIYQSRASGMELLAASYAFVVENWAEWFLPNAVLLAVWWGLKASLPPLPALDLLQAILAVCAVAAFVAAAMLFRGLLFSLLHGSSRRSRIYRYQVRS